MLRNRFLGIDSWAPLKFKKHQFCSVYWVELGKKLIIFILSGFQKVSVSAICVGGGDINWSLEGCPNTAVRLASWKKMIQQGVILYVMEVYATCPEEPHHIGPGLGGWSFTKCTQNSDMSNVMQGRHGPLPFLVHQSLWLLRRYKGFLWFKVHIWDEIYKIVNRVLIANLAFECKKYWYDMIMLHYHMHLK